MNNIPQENQSIDSIDTNMSRRDFLNIAGRTAVATIAAGMLGSSQAPSQVESTDDDTETIPAAREPFEEYPLQPTEVIFHENSFFEFENGEREPDLPGLGWAPDGHVPFVTLVDGISKRVWLTGHIDETQGSFPYIWNPYTGLNPEVDQNNVIVPAVSREQHEPSQTFRNGYSGLTSVIPFNNGLLGFTHNEQWKHFNDGSNFRASVGVVFSKDEGKTFQSVIQPILGRETGAPGSEVTGAGQPCVIKVKDQTGQEYAYIYYIEWLPQEAKARLGGIDQIYLTRMALNENSLGALEHFTTQGFKQSELNPDMNLQPVIRPPDTIPGANYAALPSISYNNKRDRFLAVFEVNTGVCACESVDGISWSQPEMVMEYPNPLSTVWQDTSTDSYSYPTLLDLSQSSDRVTGENLTMVLAKGIGQGRNHKLVAINGKLKS